MRGSLAAACAAVLLGLSPASGLPFASFAAGGARIESVCAVVDSARPAAGQEEAPALAGAHGKARVADIARVPAAFRSPSGPAPSQAPPAA